MKFRIDWGYQLVYSRRHYHPEYCWDGKLDCTNGTISSLSSLDYPVTWWGPVNSPIKTKLAGAGWKSTTRRGIAGIEVEAECQPSSVFTMTTPQGIFTFSAEDVLKEGRIVFPVGSKYSLCTVIVTRDEYYWFRGEPKVNDFIVESHDIQNVDVLPWARMKVAWVDPGQSAEFDVDLMGMGDSGKGNWVFHMHAMTAGKKDFPETQACGYIPVELYSGDTCIASFCRYLRPHDIVVQILHNIREEIPGNLLPPGKHRLRLVNRHAELPLLIERISFRPQVCGHMEMVAPRWALVGEENILRLNIIEPSASVEFDYDETELQFAEKLPDLTNLAPGKYEIKFVPLLPRRDIQITVKDTSIGQEGRCCIEAVYDLQNEKPEVKIGYDTTTVAHDDLGEMDWLLDYTHKTQLGNLIVFRGEFMDRPGEAISKPIDKALLARWGKYCLDHQIYVQAVDNFEDGSLVKSAEKFSHGVGGHEKSFVVYGPDPDNESVTMKDAARRFEQYMREHVQNARKIGTNVCFGDASGGHRYSLLAGADFIRAETMVAHSMHHLSQARSAAQTLGHGEWGVHIAIQHAKQPYLESHLGWYFLALMQSWMMGASFLYEEDSLFVLFKEERQCWNDALTKGKRDMTREFFKFVKTHPRPACPEISIGVLLGRYAAPFNGFICGSEQDPSYSVWGKFGRTDDTWGHCQPEKGQQVMDVLMPGASTHPLRQQHDRRRFYFSGTPYGDFDQVPIEADAEGLNKYKLLLLLSWHTMTESDYRKLKDYVVDGGTLFLSVPHLSTHEGREFLATMEDLALFEEGDVADLCGVKILGKGTEFSGQWEASDKKFAQAVCPTLSRTCSTSPDEDGPCHLAEIELCGATPVIVDSETSRPLLVKHSKGQGNVYLMTTWAYPGHEELSDISGAVVAELAHSYRIDHFVEDVSRETFWTYWPCDKLKSCGTLMLLNTDWTVKNKSKEVTIQTPAIRFTTDVTERVPLILTCLPFGVVVPESYDSHIEIIEADDCSAKLRINSEKKSRFVFHSNKEISISDTVKGPIFSVPTENKSDYFFEVNPGRKTCLEITIVSSVTEDVCERSGVLK